MAPSVDMLKKAFEETQQVIDRVTPGHMAQATPCSKWDVRGLLNHTVSAVQMFATCASGGKPPSFDFHAPPDIIGDDPAGAFRQAAASALAAWSAEGALDGTVTLPPGEMPATVAIGINLFDTYVHAWDIAQATDQAIISIIGTPLANAGPDVEICSGQSVNLNATGGVSYAWLPQAGLSNAFIANPVASPIVTTVYTVTVTNAGGCSDEDEITVTVNPLPIVDAGPDKTVCISQSTVLDGSASGSSPFTSRRGCAWGRSASGGSSRWRGSGSRSPCVGRSSPCGALFCCTGPV